MAIEWVDVSMPIQESMVTWPGDTPYSIAPACQIAKGDGCNTSSIQLCTHTGTHVDAPWHYLENGKRVHELDPSLFFGQARLVAVSDKAVIEADDFGTQRLPERVLLKTAFSESSATGSLQENYPALSIRAAERLVTEGVRLIGIDSLSVGPDDEEGACVHRLLLAHNIVIIEGLRLAGVAAGTYMFTVLPLLLAGADGAPCRAFIGRGISEERQHL